VVQHGGILLSISLTFSLVDACSIGSDRAVGRNEHRARIDRLGPRSHANELRGSGLSRQQGSFGTKAVQLRRVACRLLAVAQHLNGSSSICVHVPVWHFDEAFPLITHGKRDAMDTRTRHSGLGSKKPERDLDGERRGTGFRTMSGLCVPIDLAPQPVCAAPAGFAGPGCNRRAQRRGESMAMPQPRVRA
jgi:hypothetical protein